VYKIVDNKTYITVYKSICGYKAVMMSYQDYDDGGQYEPDVTGFGSYDDFEPANTEGKQWAEDENVKFIPYKEERS